MMMEYNPFGRAGGGAPNRDIEGNLLAERTNLKVSLEHSSPSFPGLPEPVSPPRRKEESNSPGRALRTWDEDLLERKKKERERYQVELRAQIAERNSRKADEDRKRKEQEEREERKIMLQRE